MKDQIKINLQELVHSGIISQEQLEKITAFQQEKRRLAPNRILMLFGVLGATLVGLGIILIIAHNWDNFPKYGKTAIAFLPLLIAQGICLYTLIRKSDSDVWREAAACFLFFGIAACIAMVSQIYHLHGSLSGFLLIWMILTLPVIYVMRSSAVAILYTAISGYYLLQSFDNRNDSSFFTYIGLILAVTPYYIMLWNRDRAGAALLILHWMIPLSLILSLFKLISEGTATVAIFSALFILLFQLGIFLFHRGHVKLYSSYRLIGLFGTLIILFIGSFTDAWTEISVSLSFSDLWMSYQFWIAIGLWMIAIALFYINYRSREISLNYAIHLSALAAFPLFYLGESGITIAIIFNIMILWIGITTIVRGFRSDSLSTMNLGICIISTLIVFRFFDFNVSFITRGIIFVCLGIAFFMANYYQLKQNKKND